MAYFFDPSSYASTLYGSSPFTRRRPSPPPATYYPREASDPYVRALAEEQAARAALQDAIKREREARQRRAEEEAKTHIRERFKREERERARQRPQTLYGACYPDYGFGQSYPDCGFGNYRSAGGYGGGMDYEDSYPQSPLFYGTAPRREPMRKPEFKSAPHTAHSQSRSPMYRAQPPSPKPPSPDLGPKVTISISSLSPRPSKSMKPEGPIEEQNTAAAKIQLAFRIHHALNAIESAHERFDSLMSTFTFPESLEFDTSFEPQGDERPKLTYSKVNAPVHAHEDALVKLLQTLDAVESHGNRTVRERRRQLVREVEKELERVDSEIRKQYGLVEAEASGRTQTGSEKEGEAMDVERETQAFSIPSEQPATKATATLEVQIDENAPSSPANATGSMDVVDAHPDVLVESAPASEAMEVEPTSPALASRSAEAPVTASGPITEEGSPAAPSDDSPADPDVEAEIKIPPPLNIPLSQSQPSVRSPESSEDVMKPSGEMQVESTPVEKSQRSSSPARRKVTVEDADEEKDYVVL